MFKVLDRSQTSREKGFAAGSLLFWYRASWTDILLTRSERVNETFLPVLSPNAIARKTTHGYNAFVTVKRLC
jgi:hypothetical protein